MDSRREEKEVIVRRGLCGFQECRLADLALDVHGLLVLYEVGSVSRGWTRLDGEETG